VVGFLDLKFFFPVFFVEVGLQAAMAAALKPQQRQIFLQWRQVCDWSLWVARISQQRFSHC
jgi:hypothetical protein